jgi:hypothetical protein
MAGPRVAVLAGALSNYTPSLRRCYRTRWKLSSILRYSPLSSAKMLIDARGTATAEDPLPVLRVF